MSNSITPSKLWDSFNRFGVVIALFASLATVVGVWFQVNSPKPEINVTITDAENLTSLPSVDNLQAQYTFNGKVVNDLWRVRLTISNNGSTTIVSKGDQKNIIPNNIPFSVTTGFEILSLQVDDSTFPNEITQDSPTNFYIDFVQWRQNEALSLTLFLQRIGGQQSRPSFLTQDRPLIDGDVVFRDFSVEKETVKQPFLDLHFPFFATILRILAVLIVVILCVLLLVAVIMETYWGFLYFIWSIKNSSQFAEKFENELKKKYQNIETWLEFPNQVPDQIWKEINIAKPPEPALASGKNAFRNYILFLLTMIILIIASLAAIAGLIVV